MKKILLGLFIFLSIISFGSVKIVDTKDEFGHLTDGRSLVYTDNNGTLQLDFQKTECIAITVRTSRFASDIETEIGFMVDSGYNRTLSYKIQKDKKSIKCSASSTIDAEIIKNIVREMEKGYLLMIGYVGKDDKMIAINIKLEEIQKGIKELKAKANTPVTRITNKTRGKGDNKQVWIEGTGWVYENLIEKESYTPTKNEINDIIRTYNISEEDAIKYLIDKHKK